MPPSEYSLAASFMMHPLPNPLRILSPPPFPDSSTETEPIWVFCCTRPLPIHIWNLSPRSPLKCESTFKWIQENSNLFSYWKKLICERDITFSYARHYFNGTVRIFQLHGKCVITRCYALMSTPDLVMFNGVARHQLASMANFLFWFLLVCKPHFIYSLTAFGAYHKDAVGNLVIGNVQRKTRLLVFAHNCGWWSWHNFRLVGQLWFAWRFRWGELYLTPSFFDRVLHSN